MIDQAAKFGAADVILVTGFLGSGKTTLLNRILTTPTQRRIAVIVNEFGRVGIDRDLLLAKDQPIVEMSNGCICCSVNGDLVQSLLILLDRREAFDTLVIETTGLAEPAPVVQSLFADVSLRLAYRLRGVVTVVDAKHASSQIASSCEARSQIAFADILLINKVDLTPADAIDALECELKNINTYAPVQRVRNADIDIVALLEMEPLAQKMMKVADRSGHAHGHHAHAHLQDIQTISITVPGALDAIRLGVWLQTLALQCGEILRIKGILHIWGDPDQLWFQGVQNDYECRPGRRWRDDEPRQNRLVFIGRDLDETALHDGFQKCIVDTAEPSRGTSDRFGRWHEDISQQRLDQIRFWMRQNFSFPDRLPILIKEVPCAKPACPPIETAIIVVVDDEPPRLFKVQASINDLTFDQIYDLIENPMPCC